MFADKQLQFSIWHPSLLHLHNTFYTLQHTCSHSTYVRYMVKLQKGFCRVHVTHFPYRWIFFRAQLLLLFIYILDPFTNNVREENA
jgi:hypothetical protein